MHRLRVRPRQAAPRLYRNRAYFRGYKVLSIESSCDDSAVCLIDRPPDGPPRLIDHMKSTLDSAKDGGIIPSDALAHHLQQLGPLVNEILAKNDRPKIDLVCATRGPGMFSSLAAGLQVGKGLAVAWNVPFIGVHHMLGHLLTPRFFTNAQSPAYPFLSLLVSGGHTMLVLSKSVTDHEVLADSIDIAVGNALDKCARYLGLSGIMLGKELDIFTDPDAGPSAPLPENFEFPLPLEKRKNKISHTPAFSFAQYSSLMPRLAREFDMEPLHEQPVDVRRAIGRKLQADIFSHIIRKTTAAVNALVADAESGITAATLPNGRLDLVCAGGVAANSALRERLKTLQADIPLDVHFADLKWCTDNALMIGWAGIEMFEAGIKPDLGTGPVAKWPLNELKSENY